VQGYTIEHTFQASYPDFASCKHQDVQNSNLWHLKAASACNATKLLLQYHNLASKKETTKKETGLGF